MKDRILVVVFSLLDMVPAYDLDLTNVGILFPLMAIVNKSEVNLERK